MIFTLGDIITDVYGYNMAKRLIWLSLGLQFIFALLITGVIYLPKPDYWINEQAYFTVFGSILRFVFAGTLANLASNFLNIYVISKLKIPLEGKLFWLRSLISTLLGGFILTAIVLVVGFYGNEVNLPALWVLFKSTYLLEIFYAMILILPASLITGFLKRAEGVDVYDKNTNFNPFNFK